MENFAIKDISLLSENNTNKTKITVEDEEKSVKEIILEGKGTLKIAVEA